MNDISVFNQILKLQIHGIPESFTVTICVGIVINSENFHGRTVARNAVYKELMYAGV